MIADLLDIGFNEEKLEPKPDKEYLTEKIGEWEIYIEFPVIYIYQGDIGYSFYYGNLAGKNWKIEDFLKEVKSALFKCEPKQLNLFMELN